MRPFSLASASSLKKKKRKKKKGNSRGANTTTVGTSSNGFLSCKTRLPGEGAFSRLHTRSGREAGDNPGALKRPRMAPQGLTHSPRRPTARLSPGVHPPCGHSGAAVAGSAWSTTSTPELPRRLVLPAASTAASRSLRAAIFPPPSRKPQRNPTRLGKSAAAPRRDAQRPRAPGMSYGRLGAAPRALQRGATSS